MAVTEVRYLTIHFILYAAALTPALDHPYLSAVSFRDSIQAEITLYARAKAADRTAHPDTLATARQERAI